ncbi:sulfatase-like hydrolase/transferase [Paracoccus laeviglucosivorans]|uniref:Sulfatase n=1 Tax=Paracoccus laeviglucosivorans TaxID=1197861 RepID=A0A521ETT2_9RHOB|nr:sulfatase-like hydrolase/transferase [Paracoccus laeviglucosivorans]SMO87356.1 Sulfatase [Paracoccus laeviglucosivorans]
MMRALLLPVLAAVPIQLALTMPAALLRPSLELLPVLLALMLGGRVMRPLVTALLVTLAVQKLADLGMGATLARPFNIAADLPLLDAAVRLIAGSFGTLAAVGAVLGALLALAGTVAALWWATGRWSRPMGRGWAALGVVALLCLPFATPRPANLRYATERGEMLAQTLVALREFRAAADADPMRDAQGLLAGIDRDVLVIFVESYGRASFQTPFYSEVHLPTLRKAQDALSRAGLATRSGFLAAPTQGGQSWLSHATFADGLWISDQALYRAALASGRQSLFHYARQAGFRTAAVMPAITRPWPEAAQMGFDRVLAAADLGYRGPAFNWVTMPDQYTLAAADRLLAQDGGPPLFAQIVLISSHAPWVPVPQLIGWDQVGDGSAFASMALAAETPEQVWRDRDNVRRHYRDALDYTLQTVTAYALRHAADAPLMIVLGDHQAAQGIALDGGRDVPIHVIGPPDLVARAADWGLAPGLVPPDGQAAVAMDRMRDVILHSYAAPK